MVDFLHILGYNTPSSDNGDRLRWTLKKNGNFDIRSHYNALQGSFVIFPWKGIWEVKDPRRVSCFVWTAAGNKASWNNILISDNMVTIWVRGLLLLIGVACVVVWGDHWFIVIRLIGYGVSSFDLLGFLGSYQKRCLIFLVGGISWGNTRNTFGTKHRCAWCGAYVGNIINARLRMWIVRETNCSLLSMVIGLNFDWFRAWGFTSCDTVPLFISSLLFCN